MIVEAQWFIEVVYIHVYVSSVVGIWVQTGNVVLQTVVALFHQRIHVVYYANPRSRRVIAVLEVHGVVRVVVTPVTIDVDLAVPSIVPGVLSAR